MAAEDALSLEKLVDTSTEGKFFRVVSGVVNVENVGNELDGTTVSVLFSPTSKPPLETFEELVVNIIPEVVSSLVVSVSSVAKDSIGGPTLVLIGNDDELSLKLTSECVTAESIDVTSVTLPDVNSTDNDSRDADRVPFEKFDDNVADEKVESITGFDVDINRVNKDPKDATPVVVVSPPNKLSLRVFAVEVTVVIEP